MFLRIIEVGTSVENIHQRVCASQHTSVYVRNTIHYPSRVIEDLVGAVNVAVQRIIWQAKMFVRDASGTPHCVCREIYMSHKDRTIAARRPLTSHGYVISAANLVRSNTPRSAV